MLNRKQRIIKNQFLLFSAQLAAHLSLIYVLLFWSWIGFLGSLIVYALMMGVGSSLTAHRLLSHKSFSTHYVLELLGSLWFTFSLQGSTISWVSMHREHHLHADHENDPHDPKQNFWSSYLFTMLYVPKLRYAKDIRRVRLHRILHRHYWPINLAYSLVLIMAFGWAGAIYLHLFPAFLCWQAVSVPKVIGHIWGYKNFHTRDDSRNVPILGYFTFGEGWHNNHHAEPSRANFQYRWFEIDFSFLLLLATAKMGLSRIRKK